MCFPKVMQYQVEKNDFLGRPGTSYKFKMQRCELVTFKKS